MSPAFEALDPDRQLGYLLALAAGQAERQWASALRAHGINPKQFAMLALLARDAEVSQAELARRVMITPQSVSESLGTLVKQGLIARAPGELGRASELQVTSPGRALLRRAYPLVEHSQREIFSALSVREQATLGELLRKMLQRGRGSAKKRK
jgi:DNA-binding MarR family transcriptional regulator